MCLYTKDLKPLVAEEDIVCYKVLKYNFSSFQYVSPYHDEFYWNINSREPVEAKGEPVLCSCSRDSLDSKVVRCIEGGFFHTYQKEEDAKELVDYKNTWKIFSVEYCLAEFIIPKGTEYYVGRYDYIDYGAHVTMEFGRDCYASKKLIFKKLLKK